LPELKRITACHFADKGEKMIPAIGVMVGVYIITRMIELISRSDRHVFVKVVSAITILVTIVSIVDLLNAGTRSIPQF